MAIDPAHLVDVLANTQSSDVSLRGPSETFLKQQETTNPSGFFYALSQILAEPSVDLPLRQMAGIAMKNALRADDAAILQRKKDRWASIDAGTRQSVKDLLLQCLGDEQYDVAHTAGMCIAKVAAVELPEHWWPTLIEQLLTTPSAIALQCLGYVCEEIEENDEEPVLSEEDIYRILGAIIDGLGDEATNDVKYRACQALFNSLDLARKNFDDVDQRNALMSAIGASTQCEDERVRVAAYECVARVADLYYEYLEEYMPGLYETTTIAVQTDTPGVVVAAIEFWSTLSQKEQQLMEEDEEQAGNPEHTSDLRGYIGKALGTLVPMATTAMLKQDEHADASDTWNIAMAGSTLLSLVAGCVKDDIVPMVNEFVAAHLDSEDWHSREAAVFAFGSIMSGPSQESIGAAIAGSLPILLSRLTPGDEGALDPHPMVRESCAWTLGTIFQEHFDAVPAADYFDSIVNTLSNALDDEPRVANNCAFALHNLAKVMPQYGDETTNPLSGYFHTLMQRLLATSEREDWDERNLRSVCYEAINEIITHSAPDCDETILSLVEPVVQRLGQSLDHPLTTADDREEQYGLQEHLCSVLQTMTNRLDTQIHPFANAMLEQLFRVFSARKATAHQEAFMAVGALASSLEEGFADYTEYFWPHLQAGLQTIDEYAVCSTAAICVGDMARALGPGMHAYAEQVVTIMLANLDNGDLHRSVKPCLLSAFGDIAIALGPGFADYLEPVMSVLAQAACTIVPEDNEDLMEYLAELQMSVVEAFVGILQGFNDEEDQSRLPLLDPYIEDICGFLERVAWTDHCKQDVSMCKAVVGLIGDLSKIKAHIIRPYLNQSMQWILDIVGELEAFEYDEEAVKMAEWAKSVVLP
uniref:Importin N-terminal domain-containing protein n=1 Tax=Bicosoecida sp. CB-2014 TaxID=1486930 RepID=A0A7S1CL41_9STRA